MPTSKDTDQLVIPLCSLFVYGHVCWRVITPRCDHPGVPKSQITPNHAATTSGHASVMSRQSALRRLSSWSSLLDQKHHQQRQSEKLLTFLGRYPRCFCHIKPSDTPSDLKSLRSKVNVIYSGKKWFPGKIGRMSNKVGCQIVGSQGIHCTQL